MSSRNANSTNTKKRGAKPPKPDEEYMGLSYLANKETPLSPEAEPQPQAKKRKSGEKDFRTKYKTEKCKFWELNGECKFGDNVKLILFIYFSVLLPMAMTILEIEIVRQRIKRKNVNSFMKMGTALMVSCVYSFTGSKINLKIKLEACFWPDLNLEGNYTKY